MITLDLRQRSISLDELLRTVDQDTVVIVRSDGKRFVLESEDAFEQEVAMLAQSETFMAFLDERSTHKGGRTLEDFERMLNDAELEAGET
ncbi:hypothetical protein [Candidatus Oscillochloris fontis]|uniref:hypothetical protein n=1 Tax=Candidatus Oscillochloris fontis TaxID=2496868 RepID=UPI00101DD876|nr:hypothetical protein [Candidatus Oscillochloris fontis]